MFMHLTSFDPMLAALPEDHTQLHSKTQQLMQVCTEWHSGAPRNPDCNSARLGKDRHVDGDLQHLLLQGLGKAVTLLAC